MFTSHDPTEVWGLFARALGVCYAIQFASVLPQLTRLVGPRGLEPARLLLDAARRDLGVLRGFSKFPTLAWLDSSDAALIGIGTLGLISSLGIVWGGPFSPVCFGGVWLCWLSIRSLNTNLFSFPWDNLILETALLGMALPPLAPLPHTAALGAPSPVAAFAIEFLLFRVMFGMGLAKFGNPDDRTRDGTFLYHFLEWQPLPTRVAKALHRLPVPAHRAALAGMFLLEIVAPFATFGPDVGRPFLALALLALQFSIWCVGSYGTFNLLTAALCVPLFAPGPAFASLAPRTLADGLLLAHALLSLPYLLFLTTWTHTLWLHAPSQFARLNSWLSPLLPLYRALAPFHVWNSYGVFVARANDPRRVTILQYTHDGESWHDYELAFLVGPTKRAPKRAAPHHPRLDYYLYYFLFGAEQRKIACLMGTNPYYLHEFCLVEKLAQKLLRDDPIALSFFSSAHSSGAPPKKVRYSAWHYRFCHEPGGE